MQLNIQFDIAWHVGRLNIKVTTRQGLLIQWSPDYTSPGFETTHFLTTVHRSPGKPPYPDCIQCSGARGPLHTTHAGGDKQAFAASPPCPDLYFLTSV